MQEQVKVKLVKSGIGFPVKQRETLKGLGLKKMNQTRILQNSASVRGMIRKVSHLVEYEEL